MESSPESYSTQNDNQPLLNSSGIKVYKRRWLMLLLTVMCYTCTMLQILQFSIISNIIVDFYDVTFLAVDWTLNIQFIFYIIFIFPFMCISNSLELRYSLSMAIISTCAGAWIKIVSAEQDRFWVVMVSFVFISISQIFLTVLPAQVASVWFPAQETALATGIVIFGDQLGVTFGCYLPTLLVTSTKNKSVVAHDLYVLHMGVAIVCTIVMVLTLMFFRSEPPTPPSNAQMRLQTFEKITFKEATLQLFKDQSFILLLLAYTLGIGIFHVLPTLLNQIVLQYYANPVQLVGRLSVIMNVMGMISSTLFGYILGKLQIFRFMTILNFAMFFVGMILFTVALTWNLVALYISFFVLGFFMTAIFSTCLEIAAELTYPVPATISSGYLSAAAELMALIYIYLISYVLNEYGALCANILSCVSLFLSTVLVTHMEFNSKRQIANVPQDNSFSTE